MLSSSHDAQHLFSQATEAEGGPRLVAARGAAAGLLGDVREPPMHDRQSAMLRWSTLMVMAVIHASWRWRWS